MPVTMQAIVDFMHSKTWNLQESSRFVILSSFGTTTSLERRMEPISDNQNNLL